MNISRFGRPRILVPILVSVLLLCMTGMAAAVSDGGGHGDEGAGGWQTTDWARVLNFAVLVSVLFYLLRKPVVSALNARIQGIRDQLKELEASKREAEAKLAEYTARLEKLDREAEAIVAGYIQQGNEAKKRILAEAEKAAEKLESQAKRNIENEFARARESLQQEVFDKALAKAEEMIRQKITTEDQDRLVDEYLEKVVA